MRTPFLKPLRDVRRIKVRAATIALMVAAGVGTYAGLLMSRDTLFHTRNTIYRELNLADLRVITRDADPKELPDLDGIPGVARHSKRLVVPGAMERKDGRPLNSLIVYLDPAEDARVNELRILKGGRITPGDHHGVVIERTLAEVHGYDVGESITLNPYTFPSDVKVVGTGMSPECLIATVDSTVFFPLKGSLGVIYASMGLVQDFFGYPLYNDFAFLYESGADPARAEQAILKRLTSLGIKTVTRRQDDFAYRFLEEALKGFSSFIPTLALVFGIVIFLVTFITSNRLVAAQRVEVGVLRALGYRRSEILLSYILLALGLSGAGGLIGAAFAYFFNVLVASRYAFALGLPQILPVFVLRYIVEGWLMAAAVVVAAFVWPLRSLLGLEPQRIIRAERGRVFVGLPAAVARLGHAASRILNPRVSTRFGLRNLFRRPRMMAATIACVALPVALAGSFVVVLDSLRGYQDEMMGKEKWDLLVGFRYPVPAEKVGEILGTKGIERAVAGAGGFAEVRIGEASLNYQIVGVPGSGWMRSLNLARGRMFSANDEKAIILNENWIDREKVKLEVGKEVLVKAGAREERLTIVGIVNEMTLGQAYVPLGTAETLLGMEGKANGFMATLSGPIEAAKEDLYRHDAVGDVFARADIQKALEDYLAQMNGIFYANVGVSIGIAALFLFGSVLIGIVEREIEYATLRAMGYDRGLIARIVLTELMAESAVAVAISVPLAALLGFFINYQQGKIYFLIPTVVHWKSVVAVGVCAFVSIPLASIPGLRHVFRLRIAQVVREKIAG